MDPDLLDMQISICASRANPQVLDGERDCTCVRLPGHDRRVLRDAGTASIWPSDRKRPHPSARRARSSASSGTRGRSGQGARPRRTRPSGGATRIAEPTLDRHGDTRRRRTRAHSASWRAERGRKADESVPETRPVKRATHRSTCPRPWWSIARGPPRSRPSAALLPGIQRG